MNYRTELIKTNFKSKLDKKDTLFYHLRDLFLNHDSCFKAEEMIYSYDTLKDVRGHVNDTPLHILFNNSFKTTNSALEKAIQINLAQQLLDKNVDIDAVNNLGHKALDFVNNEIMSIKLLKDRLFMRSDLINE